MICPLTLPYVSTGSADLLTASRECLGAACAWWLPIPEACSVTMLGAIVDELEARE